MCIFVLIISIFYLLNVNIITIIIQLTLLNIFFIFKTQPIFVLNFRNHKINSFINNEIYLDLSFNYYYIKM